LRLTPTTLAGAGAETKINGYIELASLKLDSEWAVSLAGSDSGDVPPVGLVFTGALNKAGDISPAIDTAAIEAYLTMRRMQEGVEQLETLDVSGRAQPEAEAAPEDQTSAVPVEPLEPLADSAIPDETAQPEPVSPAAEAEASALPARRAAPSAMPSASELLHDGEERDTLPDAAEIPPPAPVVPLSNEAAVDQPAALEPAPSAVAAPAPPALKPAPSAVAAPAPAPKPAPAAAVAEPAPAPKPAPAAVAEPTPPLPAEKPAAEPQTEAAATPAAEPAPSVEEVAPVRPRPSRPRRAKRPPEPPDAWKKGIGIFGGG